MAGGVGVLARSGPRWWTDSCNEGVVSRMKPHFAWWNPSHRAREARLIFCPGSAWRLVLRLVGCGPWRSWAPCVRCLRGELAATHRVGGPVFKVSRRQGDSPRRIGAMSSSSLSVCQSPVSVNAAIDVQGGAEQIALFDELRRRLVEFSKHFRGLAHELLAQRLDAPERGSDLGRQTLDVVLGAAPGVLAYRSNKRRNKCWAMLSAAPLGNLHCASPEIVLRPESMARPGRPSYTPGRSQLQASLRV